MATEYLVALPTVGAGTSHPGCGLKGAHGPRAMSLGPCPVCTFLMERIKPCLASAKSRFSSADVVPSSGDWHVTADCHVRDDRLCLVRHPACTCIAGGWGPHRYIPKAWLSPLTRMPNKARQAQRLATHYGESLCLWTASTWRLGRALCTGISLAYR
ncbi:hypothetical protein COCC4DRAFT_32491, partial [Bipolaris maydis ATCC 48331]